MLSLAILAGAVAVLGELTSLGLRNARIARDLTQAQLLCESKLSEVTAGVIPPEPTSEALFEVVVGDGSIMWLYSIEVETIDDEGLLAVRVTVTQDLPPEKDPIAFSIDRWMLDPEAETSASGGTTSGSSGSGGSR